MPGKLLNKFMRNENNLIFEQYQKVQENNRQLTLQQAVDIANGENINHVVYVDVYNSIEDKQNADEADISDWDDWGEALRYIQSQRLDPNLVTMRGEDEAETMELHITTNNGGQTWELDRYRLGQDSDIEEANTQQDVKKYIVLLGNGDDNGIFGFKAIYSNKQLALKDIADNKYPADEVEIREVSISSKTPIVVQVFDEEQRHWMFEDIFNDINTAKTELKFFADEDGFPPDVHFSQISVDDPHPDLGTKNYGLKIKYTDSL